MKLSRMMFSGISLVTCRLSKYIVDKVQLIHSWIGQAWQRLTSKQEKVTGIDALVQVNVSGEDSKFGLPPEEVVPFLEVVSDNFKTINIRINDYCSLCCRP